MIGSRASHSPFRFFRRTFLERLVLYLFVSHLLVVVVFELALGYWHFRTAQEQQFIFFTLIALDYVITWRQVYRIRITLRHTTLLSIALLFVAAYGVSVGFINGNRWPEIANDTIPVCIMAVNILRLQSETHRISDAVLGRLLSQLSVLSFGICVVGLLAVSLGRPASYALTAMPMAVYAALVFAHILARKRLDLWTILPFLAVVLFSLSDLNRSSLLFFLVSGLMILAARFLRNPPSAALPLVALGVVFALGWVSLPDGSKTKDRIANLVSIQDASRKTAVGERFVEYISIKNLLESKGATVDALGLGHGALYEMRGANRYKKDYGHAHFSWALFKLRYGDLGYVFTVALALVILINTATHSLSRSVLDNFIMLMSMISFIYLFTFVNFIFLLSGLSIFARRSPHLPRIGPGHTRHHPGTGETTFTRN